MYSIIPCSEKHGTAEEDFSILEAPEAKVVLQCDYNNRYALVSDLLLNRRPWPYYIAPFMPLATSCSITNIPTGDYTTDSSGQLILYDVSEIAVTYTSKFQDLFSEELEPNTEFQTIDNKNFTWDDDSPLSEGTEVGFMRRGVTLSKTFYDVLDPLSGALLDYIGCVNSDTVVSSTGLIFTPETLLYTPPHLSRTVRFDSTNAWQINCKFIYKKPFPSNDSFPGWNTFWNPSKQTHMRMKSKQMTFGGVVQPASLYYQYQKKPYTGVFF